MMREQILAWLTENVPTKRVEHILRVEQLATDLAGLYGVDPRQAAKAGLMHDLAKYFHPSRLLEVAASEGLEIDEVCQQHPHLLHADVSAVIARDVFGVEEPEILDAIATHTLGRPGMNKMACIIFIADSIEPGRGNSPDLQSLRAMSRKNLELTVWHTCDYTLRILLNKRNIIHPRVIATRNWFLAKWKSNKSSTITTESTA